MKISEISVFSIISIQNATLFLFLFYSYNKIKNFQPIDSEVNRNFREKIAFSTFIIIMSFSIIIYSLVREEIEYYYTLLFFSNFFDWILQFIWIYYENRKGYTNNLLKIWYIITAIMHSYIFILEKINDELNETFDIFLSISTILELIISLLVLFSKTNNQLNLIQQLKSVPRSFLEEIKTEDNSEIKKVALFLDLELPLPKVKSFQLRGKQTVYIITFENDNSNINIARSYSEFWELYKLMRDKFPKIILPPFPSKKPYQFKNKLILDERVEAFDYFLRFISKEGLVTEGFLCFLKPNSEVPIFHKDLVFCCSMKEEERIKQRTSFGSPTKEQPSVSCDKAITLKDGSENLSITLLNANNSRTETSKSKNESLLSNYKSPLECKVHYSDPTLNDIIRSGSSLEVEVLIPSLANRKNEGNEYEFHISDGNTKIHSFTKSYANLEIFHQKILNFADLNKIEIQPLPDKGNISDLSPNYHNRVLNYRRYALRIYLKSLFGNRVLRESDVFVEFLKN